MFGSIIGLIMTADNDPGLRRPELRTPPLGSKQIACVDVENLTASEVEARGFSPSLSGFVAVARNENGLILGLEKINVNIRRYIDESEYRRVVQNDANKIFGLEE